MMYLSYKLFLNYLYFIFDNLITYVDIVMRVRDNLSVGVIYYGFAQMILEITILS